MTTPLVSVITRTVARPLFLRRTLASVMAQTYPHWEIVLVNDGGNQEALETLLADIPKPANEIRVSHLTPQRGRAYAAQWGLMQAQGEYAVILDDDDTWDPRFLEETVGLAQRKGLRAVATQAYKIMETADEQQIRFKSKQLHKPIKQHVLLFELAAGNFIPPGSFLFSTQTARDVGGVDTTLECQEDWDLILRIAAQEEIGMIPSPLFNYHFRTANQSNPFYDNAVTAQKLEFQKWETYVRNKYMRQDLASGQQGLGFLLNVAHATRELSLWRCLKNDLKRLKEYYSG